MRRRSEVQMSEPFEWKMLRLSAVGCAITIIAAGCAREGVTTVVVPAGGLPADSRIELELCGRTTQMTRQGDTFVGSGRVTCEGQATVRVNFADGEKVVCKAGYTTPGFDHLVYEVSLVNRQCALRLVPGEGIKTNEGEDAG